MTCAPEFTEGFIERHLSKLLFATDYLRADMELPPVASIREAPMASERRLAIAEGNVRPILRL